MNQRSARAEGTEKNQPLRDFIHGDAPSHEHIDGAGNRWKCNSPYCTSKQQEHPDNGGPATVVLGQEPWKR